jgi:hypothetical protein
MTDLLFTTGQALSVMGLAYGCYLSLTYCDDIDAACEVREKAALPHQLAMA